MDNALWLLTHAMRGGLWNLGWLGLLILGANFFYLGVMLRNYLRRKPCQE